MKIKLHHFLPLLLLFVFPLSTFAAIPDYSNSRVPITGAAYGEKLGLIHFNYTTAQNPFVGCDIQSQDLTNPNCPLSDTDPDLVKQYSSYNFGAFNDFYIRPYDKYYRDQDVCELDPTEICKANYDDLFQVNRSATTTISSINEIWSDHTDVNRCFSDGNGLPSCPLNGFAWNDKVGWIVFDGDKLFKEAFDQDVNLFGNGCDASHFTKDEPFCSPYHSNLNDHARIDAIDSILKGYAWNPYTGWIQLSSKDDVIDSWNFISTNSQTETNWGVYIEDVSNLDTRLTTNDYDQENERVTCEGLSSDTCIERPNCSYDPSNTICIKDPLPLGFKLNGYAWSQNLGWISFGGHDKEHDLAFFNPHTLWLVDNNAADINPKVDQWIFTEDESGLFTFDDFAFDPESGIRTDLSSISLNLIDPDDEFGDCEKKLNPRFTTPETKLAAVSLQIPRIGLLSPSNEFGYCKYQLKGKVYNGALFESDVDLFVYVRAGKMVEENSKIIRNTVDCSDIAIADGEDCIEWDFIPRDIAKNIIRPIEVEGNEIRDVYVEMLFTDNTDFDNLLTPSPYYSPIRINDEPNLLEPWNIYPAIIDNNNKYPAKITSYVPTEGCKESCDNSLTLDGIYFSTYNKQNPTLQDYEHLDFDFLSNRLAKPPSNWLVDEHYGALIDKDTDELSFNPLPISFDFTPGVIIDNAKKPGFLALGTSADISYNLKNLSTESGIEYLAVDHIFDYDNTDSSSAGSALLDVREIQLDTLLEKKLDSEKGMTDLLSGFTRYQVFKQETYNKDETPFHKTQSGFVTNYHQPFSEIKYGIINLSSTLGVGSVYDVFDIFAPPCELDEAGVLIPGQIHCIGNGTDPTITIDRSDVLDDSTIAEGEEKPIELSFTPNQVIDYNYGEGVILNIDQYIAYKYDGQPYFTIYQPERAFDAIEIQNIGLEFTGSATGKDIYQTGTNDLDILYGDGMSNLVRTMNSEVAKLSTGLNQDTCSVANLTILPTTSDDCVKIDKTGDVNKTIAYYYGLPNETLILGSTGLPFVVSEHITLIVEGGASILLQANIVYEKDSQGSLGIIMIGNKDKTDPQRHANFYIHPDVTNIAGTLYTEGYIMSSSDGNNRYYGNVSDNSNALQNQLLWQGSFASRNTIGGAAKGILPAGVDQSVCDPDTDFSCAQNYDMNFLRRFVVKAKDELQSDGSEKYLGGVTNEMTQDINGVVDLTSGAYFSGGGYCYAPYGKPGDNDYKSGGCEFPSGIDDDLKAASTIILNDPNTSGNSYINTDGSQSTSAIFIEKSTVSPPPGFTQTSGFKQFQEIR